MVYPPIVPLERFTKESGKASQKAVVDVDLNRLLDLHTACIALNDRKARTPHDYQPRKVQAAQEYPPVTQLG